MVEPMELPLDVVVIVEVAEDPILLFCEIIVLFSLDADRGGGGGIFRPLLFSLGRAPVNIAEDGDFSGLTSISPFFRKAELVFPPPSHM
jgi:hypothetical protein